MKFNKLVAILLVITLCKIIAMKGNNQHYPSRSILINDGLRKLGGGGCKI